MPAKGNNISPQDFVNLKALVKKEMQRRTNAKSSGSMAAYCNSNYDYSEIPNSSKLIKDEHVQKITQPIDATTGSKTTPSSKATIYADVLDKAAVIIANLSRKALPAKTLDVPALALDYVLATAIPPVLVALVAVLALVLDAALPVLITVLAAQVDAMVALAVQGPVLAAAPAVVRQLAQVVALVAVRALANASAPVVAILAKQIARIPVIVVVLAIALITVRELAVFNVATRQPVMERVQVFVLLLPFKGGILNVCK